MNVLRWFSTHLFPYSLLLLFNLNTRILWEVLPLEIVYNWYTFLRKLLSCSISYLFLHHKVQHWISEILCDNCLCQLQLGADLFSLVTDNRMCGNDRKLYQWRFRIDIRKKFFTIRLVKQWNRNSRKFLKFTKCFLSITFSYMLTFHFSKSPFRTSIPSEKTLDLDDFTWTRNFTCAVVVKFIVL